MHDDDDDDDDRDGAGGITPTRVVCRHTFIPCGWRGISMTGATHTRAAGEEEEEEATTTQGVLDEI